MRVKITSPLFIAFVITMLSQGCNNATHEHEFFTAEEYSGSFITYIDSLYCVNDTVLLNSILDTTVIEKGGVLATKDTITNYPNPFSAAIKLPFSIEMDSELVTIFITNENKSFAPIWFNGKLKAGDYLLFWPLNDSAFNTLETGNYILDIRTGEKQERKKITLFK